MNKPIKYIVAGNYNEYQAYVKRKTRDKVYYKYVSGVDRIRGLSEIDGYYIGTFYQRPDIEDIKTHINIIKSKQKIDEITPYKYQWKDPGPAVGFVAQEIGPVLSDEFARAYNGGDIDEWIYQRSVKHNESV